MLSNNRGMREIEWTVYLDSHQLSPGQKERFGFSYENNNRYHHKISKVFIQPSWETEHSYSINTDIEVDPMSSVRLPNFVLDLPVGLGGSQSVHFGVEVAGHNKYRNVMTYYDTFWAEDPLFFDINHKTHRAFVSRSNDPNDVELSDTIQNKIRHWGFETDTLFTDADDPVSEIVRDARGADCLFGIAVPRYETRSGERPQFHYLDGEAGMALVRDIPVVIFEHKSVDLKGIPRECFRIEFNDPNSEEFNQAFVKTMLWIREIIEENKQEEFVEKAIKVVGAMGLGAFIALGLSEDDRAVDETDNL